MAARLAAWQPDYLMQHACGSIRPHCPATCWRRCGRIYFSDDVAPEILAEAARHLNAESPRALIDLSLRLHWALPRSTPAPLFVLGAKDDRISTPDDVRATARHHGVAATILPGLAHMLMLERELGNRGADRCSPGLRRQASCRARRATSRGGSSLSELPDA